VRQTLSIAYSDMQNLTRQLRYQDQHRLSTEKSREAYRQQFDIGQRTLLDLLDSQNEYFEATRAYINTRHNQAVAQARTLAGMGQLVGVLGVTRGDVPSAQDAGQDRNGIEPAELCPQEAVEVDSIDKLTAFEPKRAPGSYVVLLPSPDGSVGRVVVQGKGGEQVLAQAQQGALLDGSAPPFAVEKEQLTRDFGAAMAARPPLPEQFQLYFTSGSTELTSASRATLPRIMERAQARKALDMSVIGHTDTVGKADSNEALGLKRAKAVAQQIRQGGPKDLILSVESSGERNLLVPTSDEKPEPRNRRVEVILR
jgi:adhesin transport system outer membrane protein